MGYYLSLKSKFRCYGKNPRPWISTFTHARARGRKVAGMLGMDKTHRAKHGLDKNG